MSGPFREDILSPTIRAALGGSHLMGPLLKTTREVMAAPPTVTTGAASLIAGVTQYYPLGYKTPASLFSVAGFHPKAAPTASVLEGDNVTLTDSLTYGKGTQRISFFHTGRYLEIKFQAATTSVFFLKVDDKYESLTPTTLAVAYRLHDFGTSERRRIELIAFGSTTSAFFPVGITIGHADVLEKAPLRGPRAIIMSDSFGTNPSSFQCAFAETLGWDDVWGSGVAGTGYIAKGTSSLYPTFQERVQHDVIQYTPQVVGIVGSVNDNSYTYAQVYAAALLLYQTLRSALPDALIFAAHTTSGGVDLQPATNNRQRTAKKAAALAARVLWVDPTEMDVSGFELTGTVQYAAASGASTLVVSTGWGGDAPGALGIVGATIAFGNAAAGTEERHLIKSTAQSGAYTQLTFMGPLLSDKSAGDAWSIVGGSYLTGIGNASATTGVGNSDVLCADTPAGHPTYYVGGDALGRALATSLSLRLQELL